MEDSPLNMKEGDIIKTFNDLPLHLKDCCCTPCHMKMKLCCPSVLFDEIELTVAFYYKLLPRLRMLSQWG
jgi:hypothetical protein